MGQLCDSVTNQEEHQVESSLGPLNVQSRHILVEPFADLVTDEQVKFTYEIQQLRHQQSKKQIERPEWYNKSSYVHKQGWYLTRTSKIYYRGEWLSDRPFGFGEALLPSSKAYIKGYFQRGVANCPQFVYIWPKEGSKVVMYTGGVVNNKRNGRGWLEDGEYKYEGQWKNDFPEGIGNQKFENGDTYEGNFVEGKKHGKGKYTWKNGEYQKYQGQFKFNQMCGNGTLRSKDGTQWTGKFTFGLNVNVQGAVISKKDSKFFGNIENNKERAGEQYDLIEKNQKKQVKTQAGFEFGHYRDQNGKDFMFFEGKKLIYFDKTKITQIPSILQEIEDAYQIKCSKTHTQALQFIKSKLDRYESSFWKQGQPRTDAVVIAPICGKYVIVKAIYKK